MAQCKVTKDLVEEKIFNLALDADSNVVIVDGKISFSNKSSFEKFRKSISNVFNIKGVEDVVLYNSNTNTAIINNVGIITELSDFETPNISENVSSNIREWEIHPSQIQFYLDYKKKMKRNIEKLNLRIKILREEYRNAKTDSERKKIEKNINHHFIVRSGMVEQIEKVDTNIHSITGKVSRTLKTLTDVLRNFKEIRDPNLIEITRNMFEDINNFVNMLGDKKFTGAKYPSELIEQHKIELENLRSEINKLKLHFDRLMDEQARYFLATNPILLSDEKMRNILKNPESEEYKKMFGGAAISDINFLERLGLNVDTSSSFDGMLGQLIQNQFDLIAQDNLNECVKNKKTFISLAKKMKSIGIDLESAKDTDFIFEKDGAGNKTGNIIDVFSFSFKNKIDVFRRAIYKKENTTISKMIEKDFDYLDIFKFAIFNKSREEILNSGGLLAECYDCCERIFKEITGDDSGFEKWLAGKGYDADYEKKMKDKLGEKQFAETQEAMMAYIVEFYYSHQGELGQVQHLNPFVMMDRIDLVKQNPNYDITFNGTPYRFQFLNLIPSNESDYNMDFRKYFIEKKGDEKKILDDFYNFVFDNYTKFNLLYNGKNTLRTAFLKENATDAAFDAMKGIARFDDVGDNMKKLKNGMLQWLGDQFWDDNYVSSDSSKVALNYTDNAEKRFKNIFETLRMKTPDEIDKVASENGISRQKYDSDEEYINAIARKVSMKGFNDNFFEVTMKCFDLYAAQKTRNEAYPIAKTIERLYNQYTNEKGNVRENANARMKDYIMRSVQKIQVDDSDKLNTKLSSIAFVRNFLSKFDQMPVVSKFLNTSFMKKLSDDEKELVNMINEAKKNIEGNSDVDFIFDGVEYRRRTSGGKVIYMRRNGDMYDPLTSDEDIRDFKEKLTKYYDKKLSALGSDATLQNLVNLIRNLLLYKMLAGVSTSGIFNRIEGHLANSEMDATGYYWTPGNLNYVEQFFLGAGLLRYITKSGEKAIVKYFGADKDKKWIKRIEIVKKISDQTNIFQDMKNQFDKTIEGVQKGVTRHNFDPFQLSVNNPEFKNQMSVILAMLMDVEIEDKNGTKHKIFDKKTEEFTCFDIVNDELVLKPEFDIEKNQCWIDFRSVVKDKIDNKDVNVISSSFKFAQRCKFAIASIHGDYRKNSALGYNNNVILTMLMSLKRWLPAKIERGWSKGGSDLKGGFEANYNIFGGREGDGSVAQTGLWRDALEKGKSPLTMMLPVVLSTLRLHKGILPTLVGAGGSIYMINRVIKDKIGARNGQIESNISMLDETLQMMKAMIYEAAIFIPRNLPRVFGNKFDFDASKHSFTDEKYKQEYGEVTLGNFRACARQMAVYFYIAALGVAVKLMFWNPDDGDDDDRRKMYNWFDNNLENILSSMSATLFMIDNIEDKAEVSNIPIIRLINDIGKFINAVNEMNGEKARKYGEKVFLPIRFPHLRHKFNPFESDFEYEKDTWDDRWIKNFRTDGEWGAEQDYKHIRADIKKQYVSLWEKKKFPDFAIKAIEKQMKKSGYEDVYEIPESVLKDMISRSNLIPSRKQKEYKNKDYKFMHDVLMTEFDDNPYLKNHALRYIFGGYDNRLQQYWQRMYNTDYEIVRDSPYIDDED